jgi:hypothetical protein
MHKGKHRQSKGLTLLEVTEDQPTVVTSIKSFHRPGGMGLIPDSLKIERVVLSILRGLELVVEPSMET